MAPVSAFFPFDILIRKLGLIGGLSATDEAAIRSLPNTTRTFDANESIVHEGDPSQYCCLVLDGWACCYQTLNEGKRPILSVHVPGDLTNLQSLHLSQSDFGMSTLMKASITFIPHKSLRELMAESAAVSVALWRDAQATAAIHRAWMAGLSRRDARSRLAHLFCELYLRLRAVDSVTEQSFSMPLRQHDLADILGITPIHVNRILRELHSMQLVHLLNRRLHILDWPRLRAEAEFDPRYLYLAGG